MSNSSNPEKSKKRPDAVACGVAGLGRIGWNHHAAKIMGHPGLKLAAVCDVQQERVREAEQTAGARGYSDYRKFLKDADVELVVVATQTADHEPMTIAALESGRHVLVEKPAATSADGLRRMIESAKKHKRLLTVHHNRRVDEEFLHVASILERGSIGEVFRIKRVIGSFSRRNDWQTLRKYGGGMLGNWGVHVVDQCLQLVVPPLGHVWGCMQRLINPGDAEDDAIIIMQDSKGTVVEVEVSMVNTAPENTWTVLGSCGSIWVRDGVCTVRYFDPAALSALETIDRAYAVDRKYGVVGAEAEIPWQEETRTVSPSSRGDEFQDNLYEAIRHGAPLLVSPESALLTYEVLDRIRAMEITHS